MADQTHFTIGSNYDFNSYAPAILGSFSNVKVLGIVDHSSVRQYIDPAVYHIKVYGNIPAGTPDDYRQYYYLVIQHPNGNKTAVGLTWIDASSIVNKGLATVVATISNVDPANVQLIRRALSAHGFNEVDIVVN